MGIVTKRKSANTKLDLADDSSQMSHLLMRILPLNPDRWPASISDTDSPFSAFVLFWHRGKEGEERIWSSGTVPLPVL